MIKVAINGFGRVGKNILKALFTEHTNKFKDLKIVAINDLGDPKLHSHLIQYDSNYGKFELPVIYNDGYLIINNNYDLKIKMLSIADPSQLSWKELEVDVVLECTGKFNNLSAARQHLVAGAGRVLISAPAGNDVKTIVYGINHNLLTAQDRIGSNASCTTNCLAPLIWPLQQHLGIVAGTMTTVHAYTNDQVLLDSNHSDPRRARAAGRSMIPTTTGAATSIGMIFPELSNKLAGIAIRVPTMNVSMIDLTVFVEKPTSVTAVNQILKSASEHELSAITVWNELPLVSVDFNKQSASSIFDLTQTKVINNLVKVIAWYDNEWAFAHRMLDVALVMGNF